MAQVPLEFQFLSSYLALPMMPLEPKQFGDIHKVPVWINDKQQYSLHYMQMGFRELSLC